MNADSECDPARYFTQTRWSVVLSAAQPSSAQADAALETLCRTYWLPIYAYLRRQGSSAHDAQDLTQGFFARLLKNKSFAGADPRGKWTKSCGLCSLEGLPARANGTRV